MEKQVFAVVGGDLRQAHLAGRLAGQGYRVFAVLLDREVELSHRVQTGQTPKEALAAADVVVLPLPATADGIHINAPFGARGLTAQRCFELMGCNKLALGGMIDPQMNAMAQEYGVELVDYFAREELAICNAIPTAEGALELAMNELPTTIFGTKALITGFGRIAKVLARLLVAMGAQVTVAARKHSDFAWISICGCKAIHMAALEDAAAEADLVFNTVPAVVLDEAVLAKLPRGALVIDLASKPGGVDFATAKNLGIKTIWALSLPGKVAPISSGEAIKDTILNILDERGNPSGTN